MLTAHVLDPGFAQRFWEFLDAGGYARWERADGEPVRYRFQDPTHAEYPAMLELLGRPLGEPPDGRIIGLMPVGEDLSDLSVILLDEDMLHVVVEQRQVLAGVSCLKPFGLILLKARAYQDLLGRRQAGERVHSSDIRKHRNDVFRMAALLAPGHDFTAPKSTRSDLLRFLDEVEDDVETHPPILASLDGIPGGSMLERIHGLRELALGSRRVAPRNWRNGP
ncbi:MAG: hypothetical protein COA70_03780 [Planctomycetota bacterium]|nr:MAG: hypothetical protein COA70_03780 [Planctomycetota bacterium]